MTVDLPRRLCLGAVQVFALIGFMGCGGSDLAEPQPPVDEGQAPSPGCSDGVLPHGALYRICFPNTWNGDLVLYAHGYVAPGGELALPNDQIGGQSVAATVNDLGYAFATTSYRATGLVAPEASEDLVELNSTLRRLYRPDPGKSVVVGVSEGGLVATLAAERHPDRFDGALAACGPVGDIRRQLDHFVDFRVVFDYLFPGVIPGSAVAVPASVIANWNAIYAPAVAISLVAHPTAARQLVAITGAPVASNDLLSIAETSVGILWYNVFGTADAQRRLGGQPFDNSARVYSGSMDDAALNAGVARFIAHPQALASLAEFQTSGNLQVPVVTLHTSGDPIVPVEQESLYQAKATQAGKTALLSQSAVTRYGHCSFQPSELLGAFGSLIDKVRPRVAAIRAEPDKP